MKTNTITAVPRLRFPEFQEDEGWERLEFNKVYDLKITNSLSRDKLNYVKGNIKNIHYGDIHTKFSALFDVEKEHVPFINEKETNYKSETGDFCIEGDIVLADASEDIEDIGKCIEIINVANEKIVCGLHTIHARPKKDKLYIGFGAYLFQSHFIRRQIQLESQGAKVLGLSKGRLDKISLLLSNIEEQQKIADCLSSLDDSIDAEIQQLESLKTHKAGLLQNLFPAEDETVPNYRFPEFKDDGDWEEFDLIDVADKEIKWSFIGGPFGSNLKASDYTSKGIRVIQLQNIGDGEFVGDSEVYTSEEKADELLANNIYPNDIIMSKMGDPVGRACLIPDTHHRYVMCSDGIRLVVNEDKYNKYFIYSFINSPSFRDLIERKSTGSTRKRIGLSHLKDLKLLVPDITEQKKIANCLSSLDNLIQAKDEKIKILKQHKQGLMQQLFPVMDDK